MTAKKPTRSPRPALPTLRTVNLRVPVRSINAATRAFPHHYEAQSLVQAIEAGLNLPKVCALLERAIEGLYSIDGVTPSRGSIELARSLELELRKELFRS